MKKLLSIAICAIMILSSVSVFADNGINVTIDGVPMEFTDFYGYPMEQNDRVLLPFRQIFETYGWDAFYDDGTESVFGKSGDRYIAMQVGSLDYFSEKGKVTFDVAPIIVNGRTMVPIRVVSETLGFKVDWDDATRTVIIDTTVAQ